MVDRRTFLESTAAATLGVMMPGVVSSPFTSHYRTMKALFVAGGWSGHKPVEFRDKMLPILEKDGFSVTTSDTLDVYLDEDLMSSLDVIIQQWTMDKLVQEQGKALLETVRNGVGFAGWHGGMCDAFREHTEYQFMTGGQWVAHPGGEIDYSVQIVDHDDPITAGINDFEVKGSEQYYMHVDPNNTVLATTRFTGEHEVWVDGAVVPVVWKKLYGRGRVFYLSVGHHPSDFDIPEVLEIVRRGIRWASRGREEETHSLVMPVYDD
jgi:type 1 glutamine amidotransferase